MLKHKKKDETVLGIFDKFTVRTVCIYLFYQYVVKGICGMKKFMCFLLAAVTAFSLFSCGEQSGTSGISKEEPEQSGQENEPSDISAEKPGQSEQGNESSDISDGNPEQTGNKNELLNILKESGYIEYPVPKMKKGVLKFADPFALDEAKKLAEEAKKYNIDLTPVSEGNKKEGNKKTVFFGKTQKTPKEFYENLKAADYYIGEKNGELFVVGGSDYALRKAVADMAKALSQEKSALPMTYKAPKDKEAVELRVGTYNIQNGSGTNHDFKIFAEDIKDAGLDIVGLQEIDMNTSRNGNQDTMKKLSEYTGMKYYGFAKTIDFGGGEYGTAILSRYPIESFGVYPLETRGLEARTYGRAIINADGLKIVMINSHLSWDESYRLQREQQPVVGKALLEEKYGIFTADLNDKDIAGYKKYFKNCTMANDEKVNFETCPGWGSFDNVIATEGSVCLNRAMVKRPPHSDHYMLWMDFVFENVDYGHQPKPNPDENIPQNGETAEAPKNNELYEILKNCKTVYVPEGSDDFVKTAAESFADFAKAEGMSLEIVSKEPKDHFVCFGKSKKTPEAFYKDLKEKDYYIGAKDKNLYVVGSSEEALMKAADDMKDAMFEDNIKLPLEYQAPSGEKTVKLRAATYSIQAGTHIDFDFRKIADDINKNKIDIIGLQFVDQNTSRNNNQDTLKIISENTDLKHYKFIKTVDFGGGGFGNAIMSRYPIESVEMIELPQSGERRVLGNAVININGLKIHFLTTQLSWDESYSAQKMQFKAVADEVRKIKGPAVLAINENAPLNDDCKKLLKNYVMASGQNEDLDSCIGFGAFDNVIATPDAVRLGRGMYDKVNHSDHYMVWMEIAFTK